MIKIAERYSIARNTSNLRSDANSTMSASDVLTASGLAAQDNEAALLLWEVTFRGKTSSKIALMEMLSHRVTGYMLRHRIKGKPKAIASAALAWYMSKCDECGGEGHQIIPGTITRSEEPCPACHGTGKLPQPNNDAFQWLVDDLARLASQASRAISKRLVNN